MSDALVLWLLTHMPQFGGLFCLSIVGIYVVVGIVGIVRDGREERHFRERQKQLKAEQEAAYGARIWREEQERARAERALRDARIRAGMASLRHLQRLTPREFEETIAHNLRAKGYSNVQLVGGSGDLGVDILGTDREGRRVAVQCKRYATGQNVGTHDLMHFFGAVTHYAADRGIFITTSSYSTPARELARIRNIELLSGVDLDRRIRRLYADPEDD